MATTVTINGITKVIKLQNCSYITVQELYSRWKIWSQLDDNLKYSQAFRTVGGDPTVTGEFLGTTYFVLNNWVIEPCSSSHTLTVVGNIFTDEGDSPFQQPVGNYEIMIYNQFSNLSTVHEVSTTGTTLTATEIRDTIMNTDLRTLTDNTTFGGWVANKLLTVAKFIGLS